MIYQNSKTKLRQLHNLAILECYFPENTVKSLRVISLTKLPGHQTLECVSKKSCCDIQGTDKLLPHVLLPRCSEAGARHLGTALPD